MTSECMCACTHTHTHRCPCQTHLFHLLSEGGEDFVAFGQGALKLLKLVHVERELEDTRGGEHRGGEHRAGLQVQKAPFTHNTTRTYLLLEPDLLLLHQLTLAPGLCGIRQQLQTFRHICISCLDVLVYLW